MTVFESVMMWICGVGMTLGFVYAIGSAAIYMRTLIIGIVRPKLVTMLWNRVVDGLLGEMWRVNFPNKDVVIRFLESAQVPSEWSGYLWAEDLFKHIGKVMNENGEPNA